MKKRTAWIVSMLLAGSAMVADAQAQMPGMGPGGYGPMGPGMASPYGAPYGGQPMGYPGPGGPGGGPGPGGMPMDLMGQSSAGGPIRLARGPEPGAYPEAGGMPMGAPAGYGYDESGMYNGEGCNDCGPGSNFFRCRPGLLRHLLPFDDGGCCAPHYFDISVEYVNYRREDIGRRVDLVSDTPLGPIVLSTDDLDFDSASGFRATATHQVGPGSNIEFTYLGQNNFSSSASVSSATDSLFSAFSDFGLFPSPGQGFTETDQASFASIAYSSQIHSYELNYRQRYQCYGCKVQGSWLTGVRFFELDEDFQFGTVSTLNSAQALYEVGTYNGMVGGQGGGDIWFCVIPGLSVGAEGKLGLLMNTASQSTTITGTTLLEPVVEEVSDTDFSLLAEANFMMLWRVTQSWTFRGGYSFLYVDQVALAPENFNSTPPFLVPAFTNPPRTPTLTTDGDLFLHGFTAGFEYMW